MSLTWQRAASEDLVLAEWPAPLQRLITPDSVNREMADTYSQPQIPKLERPAPDFAEELRFLAWAMFTASRGWKWPR